MEKLVCTESITLQVENVQYAVALKIASDCLREFDFFLQCFLKANEQHLFSCNNPSARVCTHDGFILSPTNVSSHCNFEILKDPACRLILVNELLLGKCEDRARQPAVVLEIAGSTCSY